MTVTVKRKDNKNFSKKECWLLMFYLMIQIHVLIINYLQSFCYICLNTQPHSQAHTLIFHLLLSWEENFSVCLTLCLCSIFDLSFNFYRQMCIQYHVKIVLATDLIHLFLLSYSQAHTLIFHLLLSWEENFSVCLTLCLCSIFDLSFNFYRQMCIQYHVKFVLATDLIHLFLLSYSVL